MEYPNELELKDIQRCDIKSFYFYRTTISLIDINGRSYIIDPLLLVKVIKYGIQKLGVKKKITRHYLYDLSFVE